jgi:hypothetical protein
MISVVKARKCLLKLLEMNKIQLKHCRGQGYDNAANMKGKNGGVRKRIKAETFRMEISYCAGRRVRDIMHQGRSSYK